MSKPAPSVLPDRVDAQLRQHGDEAEQGAAHGRRRVDIRFGEALDLHAAVLQFGDRHAGKRLVVRIPRIGADRVVREVPHVIVRLHLMLYI